MFLKNLFSHHTHVEVELGFPPWSIKTLIIWLVGFLVLSGFVASLFAYSVWRVGSIYDLNINEEERFFFITMPSYAIYNGLVFYFIVSQLRKKSYSLLDVWGEFTLQPKHIAAGILLGVWLMSLQISLHDEFTGQIAPPPTARLRLDWRLTLGVELLIKAFVIGIVEEVLFRGIIYRAFRKRFANTWAVVFSALVFALYHLDHILNPLVMSYIFSFGIIAALLLRRTRSLNTCILFHFAGNATESVIYYLTYIIPK